MFPAIARFDAAVDRAVSRLRTPSLDHVAYALGSACDHSIMWHTIGAVRAAQLGTLRPALRLSSALAIESAITNGLVKTIFGRRRPAATSPQPTRLPYGMRVPITSSFPSGHAASAFVAAVLLHDETGSTAWYALAALVGASRVYVSMHHASDVVAGAAMGYGLGKVLRVALPR